MKEWTLYKADGIYYMNNKYFSSIWTDIWPEIEEQKMH